MFVFQAKVFLGIDKTQAVDIAHFLPLRVQAAVRLGAKQPVQAGLEGIIAPTPTGRQPERSCDFELSWRPRQVAKLMSEG